MTIWKFRIAPCGTGQYGGFRVQVPYGARLLSVGVQQDNICLWAAVDPGAPPVPHDIYLVGTGYPTKVPRGAQFLGRVDESGFVWHCFAAPTEDTASTAD